MAKPKSKTNLEDETEKWHARYRKEQEAQAKVFRRVTMTDALLNAAAVIIANRPELDTFAALRLAEDLYKGADHDAPLLIEEIEKRNASFAAAEAAGDDDE